MKKIGLGIAILLFAIIISLCSSGMGLLVIGIGIVGLIFSIIGFILNLYIKIDYLLIISQMPLKPYVSRLFGISCFGRCS